METLILSQITTEATNIWQLFHGSITAKAHVVLGENSLAILLENALSPAERKLASEGKSALKLQKYYAAVVSMACNALKMELENFLQTKIIFAGQSMDLKTGWVMCIFQTEPQAV
jgi:uncharacterized protein YbcI